MHLEPVVTEEEIEAWQIVVAGGALKDVAPVRVGVDLGQLVQDVVNDGVGLARWTNDATRAGVGQREGAGRNSILALVGHAAVPAEAGQVGGPPVVRAHDADVDGRAVHDRRVWRTIVDV